MPRRHAVIAALAAGLFGGCAVIHIQAPGKDGVEVTQRFGIVSVELKPGAGAVLVDSTSFGAMNAFDGFSVGYRNASIAALPEGRCQMVLWIRTDEQLKELQQLLQGKADVCVVQPGREEGRKP